MRRLTTPVHTFTFPLNPDNYSKIVLTYAQNGKTVLEKTKEDFTFEGKVGRVSLSQEDTEKFVVTDSDTAKLTKGTLVAIQIRVKDTMGRVFASEIWYRPARLVLNNEVL